MLCLMRQDFQMLICFLNPVLLHPYHPHLPFLQTFPLLVQHPLSPLQPLYRVHPLLHKTIRLIPLPLLKPLHPIHLLKPDSQSVATQPVGTTSNPEAPSSTATASNSNSSESALQYPIPQNSHPMQTRAKSGLVQTRLHLSLFLTH